MLAGDDDTNAATIEEGFMKPAFFQSRFGSGLTRLDEPDVEDLLDLRVVGGDVEDDLLLVGGAAGVAIGLRGGGRGGLQARDVDGHEVLGHLRPLDGPRAGRRHVEHLGPQPANGNGAAGRAEN